MPIVEFRRLKRIAGESQSVPVVQRGLPDDPLGYDTSDIHTCALEMADDALAGTHAEAVAAEVAAAEARFGRS